MDMINASFALHMISNVKIIKNTLITAMIDDFDIVDPSLPIKSAAISFL